MTRHGGIRPPLGAPVGASHRRGRLTTSPGGAREVSAAVLHRTAGNRAVMRLLESRPLQRRLTINQPGDRHEREAERIADGVSTGAPRGPSVAATVAPGAAGGEAPAIVHDALQQPGRALDAATRTLMEGHLGHRFAAVRIHDDALAARSAAAVGAHAYTVGHHVVFGAGRYAPGSMAGRHLLAHELVHVVQQAGGARAPLLQRHADAPCPPCKQESAKPKEHWLPANLAIERAYRDDPKHKGHCVLTGSDFEYGGKLGISVPKGCPDRAFADEFLARLKGIKNQLAPDIIDFTSRTFYEIKTLGYTVAGAAQLRSYYKLADAIQKELGGTPWKIEHATWYPPHVMPLPGNPGKVVCTQLTDYKLSATPGLIVYQVLKCAKKKDEEKKQQVPVEKVVVPADEKGKTKQGQAPVAEVVAQPPAQDWPRVTWLAGELGDHRDEIARRSASALGKGTRGQRYVIIMTERLWQQMIGAPRMEKQLDLMRVHGMDPRRNPVIGFRNLGWTLVGLTAAGYVVVFWGGVLVAGSPVAAGAATTTAGTATGTGAVAPLARVALVRLAGKAANDNAVQVISKAAAVVALAVTAKQASADEPTVDAVDAILAIPVERLSQAEIANLGDASTVTLLGRRWNVVGLAKVPE